MLVQVECYAGHRGEETPRRLSFDGRSVDLLEVRVLAYVKNQGLGLEVPYRDGAVPRKYLPDFVLRIDDGGPDPLNLIVETKGYRKGDAQLKAETMRTLRVPGVNNLGQYGRWAFAEFTDVFEIQAEFDRLIQSLVRPAAA